MPIRFCFYLLRVELTGARMLAVNTCFAYPALVEGVSICLS